MVVNRDELNKLCSKLDLLSSKDNSMVTSSLELYTENDILYLVVTNNETSIKGWLDVGECVPFKATVNANLFITLISKLTTETVEFDISDTYLKIIGNGEYKLSLIYTNDGLMELPEIAITNVKDKVTIKTELLKSILHYNSKELMKKCEVVSPVQTMYYLDNKGCITFTSGACVNNFTLDVGFKVVLNDRLVKLFKIFDEEEVELEFGEDKNNSVTQNKLRLSTDSIELCSLINSDENLVAKIPVDMIRNKVLSDYNYSVKIHRMCLLEALDRISLFVQNGLNSYGRFEFSSDKVSIKVVNNDRSNVETIFYQNNIDNMVDTYTALFDLFDFKTLVSGCKKEYITFKFGNVESAVVIENDVYNILPECFEM